MATTSTQSAPDIAQRAKDTVAMNELTRRLTDLIVHQCYLYASQVPTSLVTECSVIQSEVTLNHKHKTLALAVQRKLTKRIEDNEL